MDAEKSTRNFRARGPLGAPRLGLGRVGTAVLLAALAVCGACSLLVESTTDQCKTNQDCSRFGAFSVCNAGICVKPTSMVDAGSDANDDGDASDAGDASDDGDASDAGDGESCFSGKATTDPEFLNHCTDAGCEPFDNCARLGLCADAAVPPLVTPPDGGL
jgi:hypothetical protein